MSSKEETKKKKNRLDDMDEDEIKKDGDLNLVGQTKHKFKRDGSFVRPENDNKLKLNSKPQLSTA